MEAVDFDFDIDLLLSEAPGPGTSSSSSPDSAETLEEQHVPVRVVESEEFRERRWSFSSMLLWTRKSEPETGFGSEESDLDLAGHPSLLDSSADPGPPRLSQPSSLLSAQRAEALRRHFPLLLRFSPWTLRYSLLLHGADPLSFFKLTQSARYSLVIVHTDSDEVLGGFASEKWTPAKEFCECRL